MKCQYPKSRAYRKMLGGADWEAMLHMPVVVSGGGVVAADVAAAAVAVADAADVLAT